MTTQRRELRQRIIDIFHEYTDYVNFSIYLGDNFERRDELVNKIADTALEIVNKKQSKPTNDPLWNLLHDVGVEPEDLDKEKLIQDALDTFEKDMRTPDNWSWYPARSSEEKAWKYLRDFVVELYKGDQKCFQKYETWRNQPYSRGAMSNLAIRRNPENFPASWSDFLANCPTASQTKPESSVEDDGMIYIS